MPANSGVVITKRASKGALVLRSRKVSVPQVSSKTMDMDFLVAPVTMVMTRDVVASDTIDYTLLFDNRLI